jgi:hypothetical protein
MLVDSKIYYYNTNFATANKLGFPLVHYCVLKAKSPESFVLARSSEEVVVDVYVHAIILVNMKNISYFTANMPLFHKAIVLMIVLTLESSMIRDLNENIFLYQKYK